MNSQRLGGLALILGALGVVGVLAFHPHEGLDLPPDALRAVAETVSYVHAGAITCLGLLLFGLATFARLRGLDRATALGGLTTFGIAAVALISSAVVGGFGEAALMRGYAVAAPAAQPLIRTVFRYNGVLDNSFGEVFGFASAAAILIWSLGLVRERGWRMLGIFGVVAGAACIAGLANLKAFQPAVAMHVFVGTFAAQMVWMAWTGANLLLKRDAFAR